MSKEKVEEIIHRESLVLASNMKRAVAMLIDDLLVSFIVIAAIADRLNPVMGFEQMVMTANEAIVEIFLLKVIYQTLFVALYGATLGKIILKIRVIEVQSVDRPTFGAALNRAIFRLISEIIFYFGFIMALFDLNRQALHDRSAKTIVVEIQGRDS